MSDETTNDAAIAVISREESRRELGLLRPLVSPAQLVEVHKELTELIRAALVDGTDYGKVPGTDKPTLLKPGAERLCLAFGVYPRYSVIEQEVDHDREVTWRKRRKKWGQRKGDYSWEEASGIAHGLYRYVIRCELVRRIDGAVHADGIGSASTLESKYADRPRDLENTVLKMAEKRAFVAATLNGFGLSDRFTQDLDDMEQAHEEPPWARPPAQERAQRETKPASNGNGKGTAQDRAAKAVAALGAFGATQEDLERYVVERDEPPLAMAEWGEPEIAVLLQLYGELKPMGTKERTARVREVFGLSSSAVEE